MYACRTVSGMRILNLFINAYRVTIIPLRQTGWRVANIKNKPRYYVDIVFRTSNLPLLNPGFTVTGTSALSTTQRKEFYKLLGAEIRARRMAVGMSRKKVAKRLGIPTSTLRRYEIAEIYIPAKYYIEIYLILGGYE